MDAVYIGIGAFILLVIVLMVVFSSGNPKLSVVSGASLDVSNFKGKQIPVQNISSADDCATLAAKNGAPVAVYIPAMKVCTSFDTAKDLKLGPANPNMVVLSSVALPVPLPKA